MTGCCAGKRVLIAGGGTGLGFASARSLASEGALVFLTGRRAGKLEEAAAELPGHACRGVAAGDASIEDDATSIIHHAATAMSGIDTVVVSSGMTSIGSVLEASREEMMRVLSVNVLPLHLLAKAAVPRMPEAGGSIVAISSVAATVAHPQRLAYCTSKAAVLGMVRQMALDLAPRRIRVNAVSPSLVLTDLSLGALRAEEDPEVALAQRLARHPLGRLGEPEEVGAAVAYMVSDQSSWVTGQNFIMDGGLSISSGPAPY